VTGQDVNNTFIFSEGDRPEYAAKNRQRAELIAQGVPAHLLRRESEKRPEGQEEPSYNRRGRRGRWREPFRPRGVQST
jgi:transcription initiation factor TFIIF subunit beta